MSKKDKLGHATCKRNRLPVFPSTVDIILLVSSDRVTFINSFQIKAAAPSQRLLYLLIVQRQFELLYDFFMAMCFTCLKEQHEVVMQFEFRCWPGERERERLERKNENAMPVRLYLVMGHMSRPRFSGLLSPGPTNDGPQHVRRSTHTLGVGACLRH